MDTFYGDRIHDGFSATDAWAAKKQSQEQPFTPAATRKKDESTIHSSDFFAREFLRDGRHFYLE
jgi:hypothetical protein